MRDPVTRQRPVVNLDEFERRLRQPTPQAPANEDPLTELARLVGDDKDPYQQMFLDHPDPMSQERGSDRFQRNLKGNPDAARQQGPRAPVRTEPRLDVRPEMRRDARAPQPQPQQIRDPSRDQGQRQQPAARPDPVRRPAPAAPAPRSIEPERAARPAPRPTMPPAPSIAQIRAQQQAPAPVRPVAQAPVGRQPAPQRPAPQAPASRSNLRGDFAAIEAGLRGSLEPNFRTVPAQTRTGDLRQPQNYQMPAARRAPAADYRAEPDYRTQADYQADYRRQPQWDDEDEADYAELDYRQQYQPEPDDDDDWLDMRQPAPAARQAPGRRSVPVATAHEPSGSRRLVYMTAAVVLVGMGGIGVVFASKHNMASPHQIAMIKASTNPSKVQAQIPNDGSNSAQDDSVFDKTPQPPGGVASHEEQPVDLAQTGANAQQGTNNGNASSIPVPTPPSEAPPWQQDASANQQQAAQVQPPQPASNTGNGANAGTQVADAGNQGYGLAGTILSKKVKTLAVRPDGSVMPGDSSNTTDTGGGPPSMQMPDVAQGNGNAPAPQGNDNANQQAAAQQPSDGGNATGANDANDADNAPSPVRPHHVKPTRVADLDTSGVSDDTHAGSGDFAVQLAAPGSEAEAHRVMTKIAQEYQAELGDHQVKFRHVRVGDKSIYRVRVGGLSKSEATQLCGALQAKGGTCFVAKD